MKIDITPDGWELFKNAWDAYLHSSMQQAGDTHSFNEVWALLASGAAIFFAEGKSCCIVDFFHTPKIKAVNVWLCGGDLKELKEKILPEIESYGRENKYGYITGAGREAWGKALKSLGFEPTHTMFEKAL